MPPHVGTGLPETPHTPGEGVEAAQSSSLGGSVRPSVPVGAWSPGQFPVLIQMGQCSLLLPGPREHEEESKAGSLGAGASPQQPRWPPWLSHACPGSGQSVCRPPAGGDAVRMARSSVHPGSSPAASSAGCRLRLCGWGSPAGPRTRWWRTLSVLGHRAPGALGSSPATGSPAPRSPST